MIDDSNMNGRAKNIIPRKWIIVFIFCIIIGTFFIYSNVWTVKTVGTSFPLNIGRTHYSVWPSFSVHSHNSQEWFKTTCGVDGLKFSISNLEELAKHWSLSGDKHCRDLYKKFAAVYSVTKHSASPVLPNPFRAKVKKWLGNNEQLFQKVFKQEVIHVVNQFTREHTIFNPLRDQRPMSIPDEPEKEYIEKLYKATKDSCDFCKYKSYTAKHRMHRIETKYSFSASNAFKLEKWHALIALKEHHPLNWSREQFMDLLNTTVAWFKKANENDPISQFPVMIWDLLPKAGASQIHPHMQALLDPLSYHGVVESWRTSAEDYFQKFGSNYYSDLVDIYSALGLAVQYGDAIAIANLVPKKDHEIVVMSPTPGKDFFHLIYCTLRAFIEDIEKLCFSMGLAYPPLVSPNGRIPAYARIITRGAVADVRSDMSSFELFTATNVNIDPFKVIEYIRKSLKKRS